MPLLRDLVGDIKDSLYAKTKEGRAFVKDDVIININVGKEEPSPSGTEVKPQEEETPTSATEGTVYKGYTIKQEDDGTFTVFATGGSRLTGEIDTLEHAMEIVNGITVDGNQKLQDMKIGDWVYTKSHEGIKERLNGKIIDIWQVGKRWTATIQCGSQIIQIEDNDLI